MTDQNQLKSARHAEKRQVSRMGVLKRAKILLGEPGRAESVIDCVVVNTSPTGIRVRTAIIAPTPEWVTLEFPDGTAVRARRIWARGLEMGFDLAVTNPAPKYVSARPIGTKTP